MGSCRGYLTVQVCECVFFHSCFFLPFWSCFAFDLLGVQILFLRRVVFADNNSCTDLWSLQPFMHLLYHHPLYVLQSLG